VADTHTRPVAASEHELISLARALIGARSAGSAEVQVMLSGTRTLPPAISTACAALLGDTLAKLWPALWRRGGTQPGASIDERSESSGRIDLGAVKRGRIWERHAPIGLGFSLATLRLLRWLIATPLVAPPARRGRPEAGWGPIDPLEEMPLTVGDQAMIYLALDAASGTAAQGLLAAQPLVRAAPLAWLGFADRLGALPSAPPAFDALCEGAGAIVVESLTRELAQRWRAVELSKRAITAPEALIALGAAQDATLHGFLAACDRRGRRDLAGFVIDAAAPLLARDIAPLPAELDPTAPLSRRMAARVAAGALLRAVATWAAWDGSHRGVRFIDDDYAVAQLLLARFEPIGAAGAARAAAWLAALAALGPV
jgi:hypothetical protein